MGIWEYRNMRICEYGNLGLWEYGNLGIWEHGNSGDLKNRKFYKGQKFIIRFNVHTHLFFMLTILISVPTAVTSLTRG